VNVAARRLGGQAVRSAALVTFVLSAYPANRLSCQQWPVHSMDRPRPPVVDPGPERPPAPPPSDAIVLFDGKGLAAWQSPGGTEAKWTVREGYVEVAPGTGPIVTRRSFGDVQLHIEWAAPTPPKGAGQERGNSGVFLMDQYEIQVLDSYRNDTYADGQAAAVYGQMPPLVNACRPPGQWQTYDIVFRRPRFAPDGSVRDSARVTVLHNGVLVQDNTAIQGRTAHGRPARYEPHADRLPLMLQDHGNPMRFRNIWLREIAGP
jgi:3-keto-disaccharide hydrolase